jgi:hypothetical protein
MFAITLAAADLKVVAPEQFAALVEAFRKVEAKLGQDFQAAGPETIFGAQGKVWLATQLRARLEKCLEQKHQIEQRG